jgi:hypothetical protein
MKFAGRGVAPARVADAVAHALTAERPRTRYVVGPDARVQALLRAALPDRAFEYSEHHAARRRVDQHGHEAARGQVARRSVHELAEADEPRVRVGDQERVRRSVVATAIEAVAGDPERREQRHEEPYGGD